MISIKSELDRQRGFFWLNLKNSVTKFRKFLKQFLDNHHVVSLNLTDFRAQNMTHFVKRFTFKIFITFTILTGLMIYITFFQPKKVLFDGHFLDLLIFKSLRIHSTLIQHFIDLKIFDALQVE